MSLILNDDVKVELFNILWEEGREGLAVVNSSFQIIACNESFCDMTEYSEKELTGKNFSIFSLSDETALENDNLSEVLKGTKNSTTYIRKFVTKTSRVIVIKAKAVAVENRETLLIMSVPPEKSRVPPELIIPNIHADEIHRMIAIELINNIRGNKIKTTTIIVFVAAILAVLQKLTGVVISPELVNVISGVAP